MGAFPFELPSGGDQFYSFNQGRVVRISLRVLTRFDTGHRAASPYTLILAAIR